MTRLVTLAGPKGGIGKTTLAASLLVAARQAGHEAAGLDLDRQRSLSRWAGKQNAAPVAPGTLDRWRETLPGVDLGRVDEPEPEA